MKIKTLAAIAGTTLIAALLSGCITRAGASHGSQLEWHEPFHSLRSQRVTLKRPLLLRPQQYEAPQQTASDDSARVLDLRLPTKKPPLRLPKGLPAGTVIEFDTFHHERIYAVTILPFFLDLFPSQPSYTAWFTVPQLQLPKDVYFEYRWGLALISGRHLGSRLTRHPNLWAPTEIATNSNRNEPNAK